MSGGLTRPTLAGTGVAGPMALNTSPTVAQTTGTVSPTPVRSTALSLGMPVVGAIAHFDLVLTTGRGFLLVVVQT